MRAFIDESGHVTQLVAGNAEVVLRRYSENSWELVISTLDDIEHSVVVRITEAVAWITEAKNFDLDKSMEAL